MTDEGQGNRDTSQQASTQQGGAPSEVREARAQNLIKTRDGGRDGFAQRSRDGSQDNPMQGAATNAPIVGIAPPDTPPPGPPPAAPPTAAESD